MRPLRLAADDRRAAEIQRLLAADADRVAHRHAAGLDEVEPPRRDVDDDRPGPVRSAERDLPAQEIRIDGRGVEARDLVAVVDDRPVAGKIAAASRTAAHRHGARRGAAAQGQERSERCKHSAAVKHRRHSSAIPVSPTNSRRQNCMKHGKRALRQFDGARSGRRGQGELSNRLREAAKPAPGPCQAGNHRAASKTIHREYGAFSCQAGDCVLLLFICLMTENNTPCPIASTPPRRPLLSPLRRTRAPRGLRNFKREQLIVDYLDRGVSVAEIAARVGIGEKRMRAVIQEILARRCPQPPEELSRSR